MSLRTVRLLAAAQLRADLRPAGGGRGGASRIGMTALAYGLSGAVLALSIGGAAPGDAAFVAASAGLMLAAFGIVGSYDELMGRPKDNAWLATLPAGEGAHYAARGVSIGAYAALMAFSVALPVGVRVGAAHGAWAGAAVGGVTAGAVVWTTAVAVASLWGLTLALPPALLRPALGAARTALVGALVLGYQWIGMGEPEAPHAPWWPGSWLAGLVGPGPEGGGPLLLGSGLALGLALAVYFPTRYFRLLGRLEGVARARDRRGRGLRALSWPERLAVRSGPPRAAYGLALAAFSGDRLVRGRLWPAALLPLAFVGFGWVTGGLGSLFVHGVHDVLLLPETRLHLSVLVILLFCAQSLVQTLQFSDHAEAAWVFGTLPGARARALQVGAHQALVWRVLLPVHVGFAALLAFQMPPLHAAVHALFWFAIVALVTRVHALVHRAPPFSQRADRFGSAARLGPLLTSVPVALGVLLLQTAVFATPPTAVAAALGLLAISSALGPKPLASPLGRAGGRETALQPASLAGPT